MSRATDNARKWEMRAFLKLAKEEMTSKQRVKLIHPHAVCKLGIPNGRKLGGTYFIRERTEGIVIGTGSSAALAWRDAAVKLFGA